MADFKLSTSGHHGGRIASVFDGIMDELKLGIKREMATDRRPKKFAEEVRDHWKYKEAPAPWHHHPLTKTGPYAKGAYANSIKVRQIRNKLGQFTPAFEVYTHSRIAHFIEYGTGIDAPGTKSPWGRFTPTPEFACAAKTAHHFGGTPD